LLYQATKSAAIVTTDELRNIRSDIEKSKKTATREAAILPSSDIERMKRSAKVQTAKEQAQAKKIHDEQKQSMQAASKARKQKMVNLDNVRGNKIPPSEVEIEQSKKAEALLNNA
jgi:hypothetical protein